MSIQSDNELIALLQKQGRIAIPYLDSKEVELVHLDRVEVKNALLALKNFLQLKPAQRQIHARHLFAHYEMMSYVTELELVKTGPVTPDNIWNYTDFKNVTFYQVEDSPEFADPATVFLSMVGDCDWDIWEDKTGIEMVWANGSKLVRVADADPQITNALATGDPEMDKYIFYDENEIYSTLAGKDD